MKNIEAAKIKAPVKIIKSPAGKLKKLAKKIPKIAKIAPKIKEPKEYWKELLLKFLAVKAGITIKATGNNPPTNFTVRATITAIQAK